MGAVEDHTILVRLPGDLLEKIEEYWHVRRLKNRADGIRELLGIGLIKSRQEGYPISPVRGMADDTLSEE